MLRKTKSTKTNAETKQANRELRINKSSIHRISRHCKWKKIIVSAIDENEEDNYTNDIKHGQFSKKIY